ncbi:LysM peptidoglycan-binding domain-containing protein [Roseibacillus persicicus]|uniref:LysM domain-containing protein n=1 Tax=Roseibacillus persicicus TaxID=454148 RepID=A0A918TTV0_9BACT|nr:LysM domain-containing protein [Roseibacillus persicicus]GHC63292.1 hypothetical protein GCM10007100_33560 [Roseibacillus persicicus]
MKTKAFQTKRKPKKGFRFLHAKTRKRKQRVSAAAAGGDFSVEEPNLGVARALVVILILHVAAIVAIVVHSSTNDSELAVKDTPVATPASKPQVASRPEQAAKPKIGPGDRWEWVGAGDTYERIARKHSVDVQELRRINGNTPLSAGVALILPDPIAPELPSAPAMAEVTAPDPIIQETLPPIVEVPVRNGLPAEYEIVGTAQPVDHAPEPFPTTQPVPVQEFVRTEPVVNVTPQAQPAPQPAPAPEPVVVQQAPPKPATKSYTVRKGDTLWAIANRNGISVDKLLAANRNVDPKKMRPGITVKIPVQ